MPTSPQSELFPEEPFARRVSYTLADSLSAVRKAADMAAGSASFDAFADRVSEGVSANLCAALAGMGKHLSDAGILSVELSWSRTRLLRPQVASRITFPRDYIPILEEAARLFRERGPFEEYDVRGVVERLDRPEGAESGVATVVAEIEGRFRKVSMTLAGNDYELAIQSHGKRVPIIAEGVLERHGRSLVLVGPSNVRLEALDDN
jgi:hypothetical protein